MEVNIHGQTDLNQQPEEESRVDFPEEVFKDLPELLRLGTDQLKGNDKEVFFVGGLAVYSSLLPNIQSIYDGAPIESNLFLFLYGNYGTGKGCLKYAQKLASPVHFYLKESTPSGNTQAGQPPTKRLHLLPANSSKSGLIELLATNKRGLIFETEADSLTDILKQDYGNFSDILRKAFHHENISFYRRMNKEHFEIEEPKLSVLLSGTGQQLKKLVPGVENGLFSRFLYFGLSSDTSFKNVFLNQSENLSNHFLMLGEYGLSLYKRLQALPEPLIFKLQAKQEEDFLQYFQELKSTLIDTHGENMAGSVNRFAVQFFRIAMILTAIRAYENSELRQPLYCYDIDFSNTRKIMEVFIQHCLHIFESMAEQKLDNLPQNKQSLFEALPEEFETMEAVRKGRELSISESTIKRLLNDRSLFDWTKHGTYKKRK